jgi:hypothetical protein
MSCYKPGLLSSELPSTGQTVVKNSLGSLNNISFCGISINDIKGSDSRKGTVEVVNIELVKLMFFHLSIDFKAEMFVISFKKKTFKLK